VGISSTRFHLELPLAIFFFFLVLFATLFNPPEWGVGLGVLFMSVFAFFFPSRLDYSAAPLIPLRDSVHLDGGDLYFTPDLLFGNGSSIGCDCVFFVFLLSDPRFDLNSVRGTFFFPFSQYPLQDYFFFQANVCRSGRGVCLVFFSGIRSSLEHWLTHL